MLCKVGHMSLLGGTWLFLVKASPSIICSDEEQKSTQVCMNPYTQYLHTYAGYSHHRIQNNATDWMMENGLSSHVNQNAVYIIDNKTKPSFAFFENNFVSALPTFMLINVVEFGNCLWKWGYYKTYENKQDETLPPINKCSSTEIFFFKVCSSTTLCINSHLKRYKEFEMQNIWIKYVFVLYS